MTRDDEESGEGALVPLGSTAIGAPKIVEARGERVVLDSDLARMLGVETRVFNQSIRRNAHRFPPGWMFELTESEVEILRSQIVMSSLDGPAWGGRRSRPLVFSEHGVVMAASLINSERATVIMQLVVEVFVSARRGVGGKNAVRTTDAPLTTGVRSRLQAMLERLLDTVVDDADQRKLRDEAQAVVKESFAHIRERLARAGHENDEIAARVAKLLAEAEATKATAAKTTAEAEDIKLRTLARKLELLIKAEAAIARGEVEAFLGVLKKLGA